MDKTLVWRLVSYLLFRFFHLLFLIESDIYALVLKLLDRKDTEDEVEVLNIFARYQFDSTDAVKESDFLAFHEKNTLFEEICEEGWFIYSLTERYVYLVKVPIQDDFFDDTISIETYPKLPIYLFENAEKLARVQIDVFQRVAKSLPPFRHKVILLHSPPCSGGTAAGKLLQACDALKENVLVIGEPPVLTALSLLFQTFSIEEMRSLCKSTLRFSLLHQKSNQTIVLKARSSCTKIVPFIHAEQPSIQHVFVARKGYNEVISRLVVQTSTELPVFPFLCKVWDSWRWLSTVISSWRLFEEEMMVRLGPRTDVEFAMAQVYGCILNHRRNIQYFTKDMPFVEDLISDTANAIRPLLSACGISDLSIPECIEWKRNEEETLRDIWDTVELSTEDTARVKQLVEILQQDVFML